MSDNPHFILKKYWGYSQFRPLQEDIIRSVLAKNDVLALMPTGGGKSVCFQVPGMMMEGICLVISPLIALIKDQVEQLQNMGIAALAIYSGMTYLEVKKTLQNAAFGNYKFLYVSPERLETTLFLEFLPAMQPSLIVIDEAHCISQWGYDFRPSYLRIAALREQLPGIPVIALTASATPPVQEDIVERLLFKKNHARFRQSFERPNLSYSVFDPAAKQAKLVEILKNVPGQAIVYCRSRKHTQQVAALLKLHHVNADYYHAGLDNKTRSAKQEQWIKNITRVIVCTNAFGMGIDKPDVRVVVHYDLPDSLENYYQEAGRAGRDGKRSYAVLLYEPGEPSELLARTELRYPPIEEIRKVYIALMNHLQVPAGNGEGCSYDLDLTNFAEHFKLNILKATYAIQALAREELLSYNEISFKPSTVEFTVSKNDLYEFEQLQPNLEPLVKGLLRSYEGIFDQECVIYESQLARFIHWSLDDVSNKLHLLQQYHIIRYRPASDKPMLYLLKNRMYSDDFKIDSQNLLLRRQNHEARIKAMIGYITAQGSCRSKTIATYFGETDGKDCGICDNCLQNKSSKLDPNEFNNISVRLLKMLRTGPLTIQQVIEALKPVPEFQTWKVIDFLLAEGVVITDENQLLKLP